jgi:hypothetical protein
VARSTELPENVRRLVEEIETEIGESEVAAGDIAGGSRRLPSARSSPRSVRSPIATGSSARPSESIGCTRS